jgi:hypothetical protein
VPVTGVMTEMSTRLQQLLKQSVIYHGLQCDPDTQGQNSYTVA